MKFLVPIIFIKNPEIENASTETLIRFHKQLFGNIFPLYLGQIMRLNSNEQAIKIHFSSIPRTMRTGKSWKISSKEVDFTIG